MKLFFIGSLPYTEPSEALSFVKKYAKGLPFLPQLPHASPNEDMIGQILRGFQLGGWDPQASSCFGKFMEEFGGAERFKIQMAGPLTVSSTLSLPFDKIEVQWLGLWQNLKHQIRKKMQGEIWLQIDEPMGSKQRLLPSNYGNFLVAVKSIDKRCAIGIHSCASERPKLEGKILRELRFISFDFSSDAITDDEFLLWSNYKTELVAGLLDKSGNIKIRNIRGFAPERLWISTSCGLYGWTQTEIEECFSRLA